MAQASSGLQQIKSPPQGRRKTCPYHIRMVGAGLAPALGWGMLIGGIALGFNLYRLGTPSIWFDEAFSVELARQPLPLLWHIIFDLEPNMELYYLFLHIWLGITSALGFAATEFIVRLPSAIFATLSTEVVFLLGQRFLNLPIGLLAASLYLLNDLQLVYAQQVRSYSLQLLLICISWYAFLAALTGDTRQKRWWLCFTAATTLAVYANLFSLIILLSQVCTFGGLLLLPQPWQSRVKRQMGALLVSLICIAILIAPLLPVSLHGPKTGWLPSPQPRDLIFLLLSISGDSKIYLCVLAACCGLGLFTILMAYLRASVPHRQWGRNTKRKSGRVGAGVELQKYLPIGLSLVCWLIIPIIVSGIISQGATRLFSSRYLVTIVPPLLLLAGIGVAVLRWYRVRLVLALVLFMLALYAVPYYYRSAQVEDWKATSLWVEQRYQTGDGLVCYDNAVEQGCQISVEYYLHAYPSAAHFTDDAPGAYSWTTFSSAHPGAAVDPTVLAAYGVHHPRIFFIIGRLPNDMTVARAQVAQRWLGSHYHFIAQIVTRTLTIRLDSTGTTTKA